jgi:hypothetical protein
MSAFLVVDPHPSLRLGSGFIERAKTVCIQYLISQRTVEALDEGILCRLAGLNEFPGNAFDTDPLL